MHSYIPKLVFNLYMLTLAMHSSHSANLPTIWPIFTFYQAKVLPVTIMSSCTMTEITEVSIVPVVLMSIHPVRHIVLVPHSRSTRLAEILCCGSH